MVTSHLTAAAFLPGFAQHFSAAGWSVTIVCSPGEGLASLSALNGVRVVTVRMHRDPAIFADLIATVELARALRNLAPDLVLTATPKASLLGTVAARVTGVPLVVHLMWGLRSETLHGCRRAVVLALETVATRFSHRVIANSRSLGAELIRLRMLRPQDLTVLGAGSTGGVDLSRFTPPSVVPSPQLAALRAQLDELGSGPVIGFVGRITPDKGVGVLLEATERLRSAGHSCRLMLIGAIEDLSLSNRIADARVRGLPVLLLDKADDTLPYFQAMDIHCLPTLREGFPNVCLEASACGVPTVTTDATGAVDSVKHEVTGLIVLKNDVKALAQALHTLLVDHGMRTRLGATARQWVKREYDAELVYGRQERYLRQLHLHHARYRKWPSQFVD